MRGPTPKIKRIGDGGESADAIGGQRFSHATGTGAGDGSGGVD